jgi:hypothetical protein
MALSNQAYCGEKVKPVERISIMGEEASLTGNHPCVACRWKKEIGRLENAG